MQVSSRIMGFIENIRVREGERISKGQLLISLDDTDVEGSIQQVRAKVAQAEAAFEDASIDAGRYESLFSRGSASENALRKARLQRDLATDGLREARAALQTVLAQRSYTGITSPVDGVVVVRHKRDGDLATPGAPILTVESGRALLFETYVAEARVRNIQQGDRVAVSIDVLEDTVRGVVARIVPSGDPVTRRYKVKIALPEDAGLMPGMFGRSRFVVGVEQVPVIPSAALTVRGGVSGVFVLDSNNSVRFRWLRTAREWPGRVEVSAGLEGGERVVAASQSGLREGDIVLTEVSLNE